jgi:hypothetical protein
MRSTHPFKGPAAIGAAGDKAGGTKVLMSRDKARLETPWQDRQTLFASSFRG